MFEVIFLQNRSQLVNARTDKRVKDHFRQKLLRKKIVTGARNRTCVLSIDFFHMMAGRERDGRDGASGLLIGNH